MSEPPKSGETGLAKKPLSKDYANFGDPIGLVRRMLGSGDRPAYAALLRAGLTIGATPLDLVWARHERQLLANAPRSDRPVLLVTGGARTGSTFTAQVLASQLEVDWLDNRAELFPRSPLTALARLRREASVPKAFTSYYGNTRDLGAPNDAFFLWNRWLGSDRYLPAEPADAETILEMGRFFDAWASVFPLPLLNKNNRSLPLVPRLGEIIPQAHFVIMAREALPTVASLVKARRLVHGDVSVPWGVMSKLQHAEADPLGYIDDICEQVAGCISAAKTASERLGDRVSLVPYESLIQNPTSVAAEVAERAGIQLRPTRQPIPVEQRGGSLGLSSDEQERAQQVLARLGLG